MERLRDSKHLFADPYFAHAHGAAGPYGPYSGGGPFGAFNQPGSPLDHLSEMQDSIGRMLGDRIDDVNTSVNGDNIEVVNGPQARFGHEDLAHVLKYATKDQDGFDALVKAQLGRIKTEIDDAAARGDQPDLEEAAAQGSRTLGAITEARLDGLSDEAKAQDQAYGLLARAAKTGVGLVPVPGSAVAAEATDVMFKHLAPNAIADVRDVEASYDAQADQIVQDMLNRSVTEHRFYGDDESPKDWLDGNPGRTFLDDGRVMPWDELKTNKAAYASFDAWAQNVDSSAAGHESASVGYSDGGGWYTTARDAKPGVKLPTPGTPKQGG